MNLMIHGALVADALAEPDEHAIAETFERMLEEERKGRELAREAREAAAALEPTLDGSRPRNRRERRAAAREARRSKRGRK